MVKNKKIILIILLIIFIFIVGCDKQNGEIKVNKTNTTVPYEDLQAKDVSLKTDDGVALKASFYAKPSSKKGLILLHQFSSNKESYMPFIQKFQETHNVIAIDLRGHGDSAGNLVDFSNDDFIAMEFDAKAAYDYLARKEIMPKDISLIGASIGANTAQNFASKNSFDKLVLLSPGLTYKGINFNMVDNSALIIVAKEDLYSASSVGEIKNNFPNSEVLEIDGSAHGTNMLNEELMNKIVEFLN